MKYIFIAIAALVLGLIVSLAFPSATIWQVAILPAAVVFSAVAINLIKGK